MSGDSHLHAIYKDTRVDNIPSEDVTLLEKAYDLKVV